MSAKIRSDFFESLLHRSIGFFDLPENSSGTLTTRLAEDSNLMHKATSESLAKQTQAFFSLLFGFIISFTASWKIALVTLATLPINVISSAIQMTELSGTNYEQVDTGTSSSHVALLGSAFTHMRTVNSLSLQYKVREVYNAATRKIAQLRERNAIVSGLGFGLSCSAEVSTYALVFWYGAQLIEKGEITFLQMFMAVLSVMMGIFGLGAALQEMADQKRGLVVAKRVFESIDNASADVLDGLSEQGVIPASHSKGKIEFVDVSFSYPNRRDFKILDHFSLLVEPREMVALVGTSGSGKSTIMSLLLRFYDPDEGVILLDGVDIKTLNIRWLRNEMGYVSQEPVLFAGTVHDNVARGRGGGDSVGLPAVPPMESFIHEQEGRIFGEPESAVLEHETFEIGCRKAYQSVALISPEDNVELKGRSIGVDEDIVRACKLSHCHEFITTFPKGYDTDVGEGSIMVFLLSSFLYLVCCANDNMQVSGGQKQRIAISRAIIKNPPIMLLDEGACIDTN